MKTCPYCGAEHPDDAVVCAFDQTRFEQPVEATPAEKANESAPIFGTLSIVAPFVSGLLILIMTCTELAAIFLFIPIAGLLVFFPPVFGFIFAVVAWQRRERNPVLWWIGLVLNSGLIILFLILIAQPQSHSSC